jgi:hypothetical protein
MTLLPEEMGDADVMLDQLSWQGGLGQCVMPIKFRGQRALRSEQLSRSISQFKTQNRTSS